MDGKKESQICNVCVMDTSDPLITFDENGQCSHCHTFIERAGALQASRVTPESMFSEIKERGAGQEYDCILGLSGGLDSSYLALLAKQYEMRPLVVHVDAGWNSDVSVQNIRRVCEYCDYDLHTYVVDWDLMKRAHRALLLSDLANQDVVQDHIFFATLYKNAKKHKIKAVLNGSNHSTEGVNVASWQHAAMDASSIRDIFKKFGEGDFKDFETMSFIEYYFSIPYLQGLSVFNPLDYMNYDKMAAESELAEKMGYISYARKHGESRFTSFFQNHYLPKKFGFDKRKAHFSAMILSGQITRENALEQLAEPLYEPEMLEKDLNFIASKLDFSVDELQDLVSRPGRSYKEFKNWDRKVLWMRRVKSLLNNTLGIKTKAYH